MIENTYKDMLLFAPFGYAYHKIILDSSGIPVDFEFIDVNKEFEKITGLRSSDILNTKYSGINADYKQYAPGLLETYGEVALKGTVKEIEHYHKPSRKWYKIQVYSNKKYYFTTIYTNITKEKTHAALELQKNSDLLNGIFESIQDGISVLDTDFSIIYTNKAMQHWYKQNMPLEGKKCYEVYHNRQKLCEICPSVRCLKTGKIESDIVPGIPGSGIDWVEVFAYPMTNPETGEISGIVEFVRDITDRVNAEKALQESKEYFAITLHSIGDGVISTDLNGNVISMNPVAEKLTGWSLTEAKGKPLSNVFNIINSNTRKIISNPVKKVLESGHVVGLANHTLLLSSNGEEHQIADSAAPIKDEDGVTRGVVLVFSDVTEKYKTEDALSQSEKRLSFVLDATTDGIFDWNLKTNEIYFSPQFYRMLGFKPGSFEPNYYNWRKLIHPEDINDFEQSLNVAIKDKKLFSFKFRAKTQNQDWKWIDCRGKVMETDKKGCPVRFIGTNTDITESKKAEEELYKEKHFFQTLFDTLPDLIYFKDEKNRLLRVNKSKAIDHNSTPENMIGKTDYDFYPEKIARKCFDDDHYVLKTGNSIVNKQEKKYTQNQYKWILTSKFPLKDINGDVIGTMGLSRDINQQKKAEEELIYRNKKLKEQNKMFLELIHNGSWHEGDLEKTVNEITEISAKFLECERVSVWWYNEDHSTIKCYDLYELSKNKHTKGEVLDFENFPAYSDSHKQGNVITAEDVLADTVTSTIPHSYYKKHNIYSLLDAPIIINKNLGGLISFESVGKKRSWSMHDELFAVSMTTLISLCYEASENQEAQSALIASEKRYRTLLEKAFDGIYLLKNNRFEYVNKQFCKLTGYSHQELMNKDFYFSDLITDEAKELFQNRSDQRKKGFYISNVYSFKLISKSGEIREVEASATELGSGKTQRFLGIIRDITEQRKSENLEREVQIAKKSAEFKQKFLANMSHEIRTPLTGMLGLADILAATKLSSRQKRYIDTLIQSGENLKEIINLILDYSKIESGQITLKSVVFSTSNIFDNVASLFYSICNKNLSLETNVSSKLPAYIKTDQQRLNQILNNLVSNAVKFTKKGKISLAAELESVFDQDENTAGNKIALVKVEVADTGAGIEPDVKEHLFKPFSQIESGEVRTIEGTGLGLSICKELTEMLGGEIGVESQPGKGSKFWFTFKAEISQETDTVPLEVTDKQKPAKTVKLNILLVEDIKVNQMVVSLMLKSLGHKVEIANNGKEALKKFKPGRFDLILMDIQMPVMDGITATKKLKQNYNDLPPIIGLSANAFEGDREKYMQQGMDEYLIKPIKSQEFKDVLNKIL